jgi:RND family efflux transporter MFP subunit
VYNGNIVMSRTPLAVGVLILGLSGCGSGGHPPLPPPLPGTPVVLATPAPAAAALPVPAIGRLERADEATLAFLAAGVIERIEVDIGDRVRRGQLLARLTPTALEASVAQAEATLAQARRDVERAQSLRERALVPQQQLDDARTRADVAAAALKQSRFVARYGRIVAEADGVVLARLAEPGEVVAAGTPVLKLSGQGAGWRVRTQVADRDGLRLKPGDAARVRLDALGGEWPAVVERVGGEVDARSGGIAVDLALAPREGAAAEALKSGLIARAWIEAAATVGLAVPTSALVAVDEGRGRIFVAIEGRAVLRELTLGEVGVAEVQVLEGLAPTDRVVVEGAAYLDEGEALRELAATGAQP